MEHILNILKARGIKIYFIMDKNLEPILIPKHQKKINGLLNDLINHRFTNHVTLCPVDNINEYGYITRGRCYITQINYNELTHDNTKPLIKDIDLYSIRGYEVKLKYPDDLFAVLVNKKEICLITISEEERFEPLMSKLSKFIRNEIGIPIHMFMLIELLNHQISINQ